MVTAKGRTVRPSNMGGGMSADHCFTSDRYTAIQAVTGGLEPSKSVTRKNIADLVPEK